jgi:hypothetical protein
MPMHVTLAAPIRSKVRLGYTSSRYSRFHLSTSVLPYHLSPEDNQTTEGPSAHLVAPLLSWTLYLVEEYELLRRLRQLELVHRIASRLYLIRLPDHFEPHPSVLKPWDSSRNLQNSVEIESSRTMGIHTSRQMKTV